MKTLNTIQKFTFLAITNFIILNTNKRKFTTSKSEEIISYSNLIFRTILFCVLFMSSYLIKAQDTLYFRNETIVSAIISEISISEITYTRFDNPKGPTYTTSKNEIKKIKYANGVVETIAYEGSNAKDSVDIRVKNTTVRRSQLVLIGTEVYYDNKVLGKLKEHHLLKDKALSENQINLVKQVKSLKQSEQGYKALGAGLFVTGFVIPAAVTYGAISESFSNSEYDNAVQTIFVGAITGALFRIAGHVVAKIGKNKTKARRLDFISKHSQNEIIY